MPSITCHWRVYRSAPGSPYCNPAPLARGDNRAARLISTSKRLRIPHLEAITHIVTFRVSLCPDQPTLLSTQVVCSPDVRGELKQLMLFYKVPFLLSIVTNDSLYDGERKGVATSKPFCRSSSHILCPKRKERIASLLFFLEIQ
ncbi:hypothetical protein TNCV_5042871 [Trichonephila clavipes]|nr:hypothetical protein TNCV_5042871 [Trichonephila clavipes]